MGDPCPFPPEDSCDVLRSAGRMMTGVGVTFDELVSSERKLHFLRQIACHGRTEADIRLELFRLRARWERLCELTYESA